MYFPQSYDEKGSRITCRCPQHFIARTVLSLRCALIWASQFRKQGTITILSATLIHWRYIYPFMKDTAFEYNMVLCRSGSKHPRHTLNFFFLFFLFCVYLKARIKVSKLPWTKSSSVESMDRDCCNFEHKTVKTVECRTSYRNDKQNHQYSMD